jgi:hypothetical protein
MMFRKLYSFLPAFIANRIYALVKEQLKQEEERRFKQFKERVPQIELKADHIKDLKVLTNKDALLEVLPKHGVVAEIGLARGDYSEKIISRTEPQSLHLIDSWTSEKYKSLKEFVKNRFSRESEIGLVHIHEGISFLELEKFNDGYFDWVYIDTDHTYETTAKELEISRKKVKVGGLICGHDYVTVSWQEKRRYGVIEAVHEFCTKYNWGIVYLTHENHRHLSFALKEISI